MFGIGWGCCLFASVAFAYLICISLWLFVVITFDFCLFDVRLLVSFF